MPSSKKTVLKELYRANSVTELNTLAEIKAEKTANLNLLCKSADKVFLKAQEFDIAHDEEMAYVFFMRYFNIFAQIKKSPQYKKEKLHIDKFLGETKPMKAINRAEKLQSSLVKRYEEREKLKEDEEMAKKVIARNSKKDEENQSKETKKQVKTPSTNDDLDSLLDGPVITSPSDIYQKLKVNHSSVLTPEGSTLSNGFHDTNTLIPDLSKTTPFFTAEQLYELMNTVTPSDLLILDLRPQKEYARNHIHHKSSINIPAEYLQQGVSVSNIDRRIPERTRLLWCDRGTKNHIVILDKCSKVSDISPASKIHQFKDAIFRYDSSCSLTKEPLILDGGFDNWLWHYPSLATTPELPTISPSSKLPETVDVSSLDFPEIPEEKTVVPIPPPLETQVKPSPEDKKGISEQNELYPQVKDIKGRERSNGSLPLNNEVHRPEDKQIPAFPTSRSQAQVPGHPTVPVSQPQVPGHPTVPVSQPQVPGHPVMPTSRNPPSFTSGQSVIPGQHTPSMGYQGGANSASQPRGVQGNGYVTTAELPPGWEKCIDTASNRVFYKDHITHTTHWNLPNATPMKPQVQNTAAPNPPIQKQQSQQQQQTITKQIPQPKPPTPKQEPSAQQPQSPMTSRVETPHSGQMGKIKSNLRRSLSSPNLAKLEDSEPHIDRSSKPVEHSVQKPTFNRNSKPLTTQRLEALNPVHGGIGSALTGLRNLGNTCYMNSVLQCMFSVAPLAGYFVTGAFREDLNTNNPMGTRGELAEQFSILVRVTYSGHYKSISPTEFKKTVGKFKAAFSGFDQQDSQEFLTLIMDKLHEDLNKITKKPYLPAPEGNLDPRVAAETAWANHKKRNQSIMVELFDGLFMSTVRCMTCGKESVTFETFSNLTLPLPANSNHCTLKDCLKLFTRPEKMSGDDKWFCPKCKQHREAIKQLQVWRLPPILIIHLKRFQYDGMWRQKLQTSVSFPLRDLDMSGYVSGPRSSSYNLFSVSNHYGTMHGGHYTAFCNNSYDKRWYKFDDQLVTEITNPNNVVTSAGYLLFYTSLPFKHPRAKIY